MPNKYCLGWVATCVLSASFMQTAAQESAFKAAGRGLEYKVEAQGTASTNNTPLWLNANKYGLSSVSGGNGYLEVGISRDVERDSARNWRVGYGLDVAVAANFLSTFVFQQGYLDVRYKKVGISIGQKERLPNLKDAELSSGSQTFGTNARPIPDVRFEIPEYISITGKSNWLGIRGHFGYGMLTDGRWKSRYATASEQYVRRVLYHSKSGFLRIGNEDKFPLVLEGGVEMACQFGGVRYAANTRKKDNLYGGLKDFFTVIYSGGADPGEGIYANASGNTVGSWLFSLSYRFNNGLKLRAYYDHFFEDHSQLFWQYGWRDGMIGGEVTLPANRFVDRFVYEYLYTKSQSGPVYHDHTPNVPDQISAVDNYYNHGIYAGWQHWGQAVGNPLYLSPLYRHDGRFTFSSNRFIAHHFGIKGHVLPELAYRALYSHTKNWGTYRNPYEDVRKSHSFMLELLWAPSRIARMDTRGWQVGCAFGIDRGAQTGDNTGVQFTLIKRGWLTR